MNKNIIDPKVTHLSKGNRYRGTENIYCEKSRLQLSGESKSTFAYKKVTCLRCLQAYKQDMMVKTAWVDGQIDILKTKGES